MDALKPWHLYLLLCRNGSYYAGITNDLERRFQAHLRGTGARYTRANPPVQMLASHPYPDRASASRAECALKRLPRARKLAWPGCRRSRAPSTSHNLLTRRSRASSREFPTLRCP
ncbi:hypothetical protein XAC3562_650021 [Xanthomonas citri pv. citri]|uniref:GIY-YIG domain-containing protein n=1 Tax=Xanthomonas citri pv. citri TaxID=611301 RepID=A0A0U4YPD5_XANCI|nr:hypothetical protein XAC3562_650021 [Xanthomonas citri pv. citri]CEH40306.1 hypothetical protein XACLD7_10000002 [Xanthomonas citri pv. citri]CEH75124.1 hypothetical protein XACLH37_1930022 [Xanthomonas citri pv. citri]CEJ24747.1 hypothetical protein XACE116_8330002 [Xanthomonas citri pv. citri]CEJ32207.1 hypothetical protein XACE116_8330002 [Xanthomonas citri pv. citri]